MATVLEQVPVDEITAQARQVSFLKTVLTWIGFVLFAVGWTARTVWLSLCWCAVAVRAGWRAQQTRESG